MGDEKLHKKNIDKKTLKIIFIKLNKSYRDDNIF